MVWSVGGFFNYWAMWRTRNLPASQGGSYNNPFNDVKRFCCIYNKSPCALDVLCKLQPSGIAVEQQHLQTSVRPLYVWFWYLLAILACTMHLWSFGTFADGESEAQTILGVIFVGLALFITMTQLHDVSPDKLLLSQ